MPEDAVDLIVKVEGAMNSATHPMVANACSDLRPDDPYSTADIMDSNVPAFVGDSTAEEDQTLDLTTQLVQTGSDSVRRTGTPQPPADGPACKDVFEPSHIDVIVIDGEMDLHKETDNSECQVSRLESAKTHVISPDRPGTSCHSGATSIIFSSQTPPTATVLALPNNHKAFYQAVRVERPYGCTRCNKRFCLESDLQKHLARHTQEKPYTCQVCGKSFVCQSQLDVHGNVHTGERPFRCSICNRQFSHPSNMKRHQKMQH